jgi:hypothetical protein
MNVHWNIETVIILSSILFSCLSIYYIVRVNFKQYGALFLLSGIIGNILCYVFVKLNFYSYPYRLFPHLSSIPLITILTAFPFIVLLCVKFSPKTWAWKIPFYWAVVHLGMLIETLVLNYTNLIEYNFKWDLWDSYTWWWIYLLIFEWIGGLIISSKHRTPIQINHLLYGKLGWAILHFILILTIFLGGFHVGTLSN